VASAAVPAPARAQRRTTRWERADRWAPFTGLVFAAIWIVGIFTNSNSTPNAKASGQKVIAYYSAHHSAQMTQDILLGVSCIFFLLFVGSLYDHVRVTPAARRLAAVGFGAAFLFVAGLLLFTAIDIALSDVPTRLSPAAAQALNVLENDLFLPFAIGAFTFGIGMGLAMVRCGRLPVWLGWLTVVLWIVSGTPAAVAGFFGWPVWAIVTSILIYRRSGRAEAAGAQDATA
jgi:hypothetical protein